MRLVRLERQQSRVADDIRAALASLGRGSTVVGGIALIGVGTVTDRPIEAVVLLPHGVIIVIGVDLPDPALRLEAPLGAEWKADGWPLVADDDAVNPATEALDLSQVCESRITELVPGTAPVGTIVAVGPYVETVDQPATDLAGPVRVLHPTPTTMLAAAVSLATAHRPRSVDQVRALIRGLAPDAPDFPDEILLGEGFSRFSDDTPPESLWDTKPRPAVTPPMATVVTAATGGAGAAGAARLGAGWRTETPVAPSASGQTQVATPPAPVIDHVLDHASSGSDHATSALDHASSGSEPADAGSETTRVGAEPASIAVEPESSATDHTGSEPDHASGEPDHPSPAPDQAGSTTDHATSVPDHASGEPDHASLAPDHTNSAPDHTIGEPEHASSAPDHTRDEPEPANAVVDPVSSPSGEGDPAADPAAAEGLAALGIPKSVEPSVSADSVPAKASATAPHSTDASAATKSVAETDTSAGSPPVQTVGVGQNTASMTSAPPDPTPPRTPAMAPNATVEPSTTTPAQALVTVQEAGTTFAEASASTVSLPAPISATVSNASTSPGATKSAEPETASGFADSERTETLAKSASALPVFPGADQIPPYRPATDRTERTESPAPAAASERTETLKHPTAAAPPPQEAYPHGRPTPLPRQKPPGPTSRTVRWLPLGAIGLLVALVVAAVVVATSGDDTTAAPAAPPSSPAGRPPASPSKVAPAESLQFSLRAAGGDQRCASHAFGDAQASLQQTSCSGVRRASYATTVDGRAGAVTIGVVAFPDAAQAAAFKTIADTPGGGGILDLATETGKWGTSAPRFENAAYTSRLEGTSVRLVQAVWVPGPSTPDDPGLARAAKAALDQPTQ